MTCWWSRPITAFSSVWVCRSRTFKNSSEGLIQDISSEMRSSSSVWRDILSTVQKLLKSWEGEDFPQLTTLTSICAILLLRPAHNKYKWKDERLLCLSFVWCWLSQNCTVSTQLYPLYCVYICWTWFYWPYLISLVEPVSLVVPAHIGFTWF